MLRLHAPALVQAALLLRCTVALSHASEGTFCFQLSRLADLCLLLPLTYASGGVWKNTEDEILKAAVMKYGKNQWSRIASLMVRKSAKQCKARWYEWLDPAIKKTEWTRAEDEKLLHLAKLMPTQWRTIAPIVGRTATQCLERYERLLDAATAGEDAGAAADDPRRLRPGEIDPHPETKPARPDAVDMNDEEKEMLSEARARLANTKGKKAKRRAREKQLEEAKRLATLQKVREMRAAGLDPGNRMKKRKDPREPDYINEVPFERPVPMGFHDVSEEPRRNKSDKEFLGKTREEIEGRARVDMEKLKRKRDMGAQKQLMEQDPERALALVAGLNEAPTAKKRVRLNLPAPQVSDRELEELARAVPGEGGAAAGSAGGAATAALMGDYASATPASLAAGRTPARTPAPEKDAVQLEAENLARMAQVSTSVLAGGANPELHPSDFGGAMPVPRAAVTPNPLASAAQRAGATPAAGGSVRGGAAAFAASMTPHLGAPSMSVAEQAPMPGATPGATPSVRDQLGINATEAWEAASEAEGRRNAKAARGGLLAALSSLPAPKNEYDIVVPDAPADKEPEDEAEPMEEDAADVDARREAARVAAAAEELARRSSAVKRGLPRPLALNLLKSRGTAAAVDPLQAASQAIDMEMLAALEHDAAAWPVDRKAANAMQQVVDADAAPQEVLAAAGGEARAEAAGAPAVERFGEEDLASAAAAIEAEAEALRAERGAEEATTSAYAAAARVAAEGMAYSAEQRQWVELSALSEAEAAAAAEARLKLCMSVLARETKRADKAHSRAATLTAGLDRRAGALDAAVRNEHAQLAQASRELECFRALKATEDAAAPARLERLKEEIEALRSEESELQERFKAAEGRKSLAAVKEVFTEA